MDKFKFNPAVISILVIVAFGAVLTLLLLKPVDFTTQVGAILNMLVGTLAAKFGDVVNYHIGSSAGSDLKTDIIARSPPMVTQAPVPQPNPRVMQAPPSH